MTKFETEAPVIAERLTRELGFGRLHNAAALGNSAVESEHHETMRQRGGSAYGRWQWDGARRDAYFASVPKGQDPADLAPQLDFLVHELKTTERGACQDILKQTNLDSATEVFCTRFERAGTPHMDRRKAEARAVYEMLGETAPHPAPAPVPTTPQALDTAAADALALKAVAFGRARAKARAVFDAQLCLLMLGYDVGQFGCDGDFGRDTETAVRAFQARHADAGPADGEIGPLTWGAIERAITGQPAPTSVPAPQPRPEKGSAAAPSRGDYVAFFKTLIGTKETIGGRSNPVILGWAETLRKAGALKVAYTTTSTPWCALTMLWVMWSCGYTNLPSSLLAADWAKFGRPSELVPGAICVFERVGGHHVCIYLGNGQYLGGNQADPSGGAVNVHTRTDKPIAMRLPA